MKIKFFVLFCSLFLIVGCKTWENMSSAEKVIVCQKTFTEVLKPKCANLAKKGQKYVDLCEEAADDMSAGCTSIVLKDGSLMCDRISSKAAGCKLIIDNSDKRELNVALCEEIVNSLGTACKLMAIKTQEPKPTDPE